MSPAEAVSEPPSWGPRAASFASRVGAPAAADSKSPALKPASVVQDPFLQAIAAAGEAKNEKRKKHGQLVLFSSGSARDYRS